MPLVSLMCIMLMLAGCGSAAVVPMADPVPEANPASNVSEVIADVEPELIDVTPPAPLPVPPPDVDADGVLDHDDNCPTVANADQMNHDARYAAQGLVTPTGTPVAADTAGDMCDADRDGDGLSVTYVDGTTGDDDNPGTYAEPVRSIARGLILAQQFHDTVAVAAGTYTVATVVWPNDVVIRGGYSAGFTTRSVKNEAPTFATIFKGNVGSSTLHLTDVHGIQLDGIIVALSSDSANTSTIHLQSSGMHLIDSVVLADDDAETTTAITARASSSLTLERSQIRVTGEHLFADGIAVRKSAVHFVNTIVTVSSGVHARGVVLDACSGLVLHNTLRVGSNVSGATTGYALVLSGATLVVGNNIFATEQSNDQSPLVCNESGLAQSQFSTNLLAVDGGQGPQPLFIDCDGTYVLSDDLTAEPMAFAETSLVGTLSYSGPLSTLMDDDATLFGPDGVNAADQALADLYMIVDDAQGASREEPFDVGAMEL